jgi:hypothetical protein
LITSCKNHVGNAATYNVIKSNIIYYGDLTAAQKKCWFLYPDKIKNINNNGLTIEDYADYDQNCKSSLVWRLNNKIEKLPEQFYVDNISDNNVIIGVSQKQENYFISYINTADNQVKSLTKIDPEEFYFDAISSNGKFIITSDGAEINVHRIDSTSTERLTVPLPDNKEGKSLASSISNDGTLIAFNASVARHDKKLSKIKQEDSTFSQDVCYIKNDKYYCEPVSVNLGDGELTLISFITANSKIFGVGAINRNGDFGLYEMNSQGKHEYNVLPGIDTFVRGLGRQYYIVKAFYNGVVMFVIDCRNDGSDDMAEYMEEYIYIPANVEKNKQPTIIKFNDLLTAKKINITKNNLASDFSLMQMSNDGKKIAIGNYGLISRANKNPDLKIKDQDVLFAYYQLNVPFWEIAQQ